MNPILWQPDAKMLETAKVTQYMRWLSKQTGLSFEDYNDLWQWSIDETDAFWQSIWDYFDIQSSTEYSTVLQTSAMPGAEWFSGASVNYAAQVFRNSTTERPAIVFQSETTALQEISWAELEADVASMAAYLRRIGVRPGDRVVAYLPNIP